MKVYVSSTYEDLKDYRKSVCESLRKMELQVIAMEDYVARDERPPDKCLADVASCDIYIGIFAFRYGHVPTDDNPQQRSITELEYRHAVDQRKQCLIFIVKDGADWPTTQIDFDMEARQRILALKKDLTQKHTVSYFTNKNELAALVVPAVHKVVYQPGTPKTESSPTTSHQPREIVYESLVVYSHLDQSFAEQMAAELSGEKRLLLSPHALFADKPGDFDALENQVQQCHAVMVVLSEVTLNQMEEASDRTRKILKILKDRTGKLIAVSIGASPERIKQWEFDEMIFLDPWSNEQGGIPFKSTFEISRVLPTDSYQQGMKTVGLPFVVVAMTLAEAVQILENPLLIKEGLPQSYKQFCSLRRALGYVSPDTLLNRYGQSRESWKPFVKSDRTVHQVVEDIITYLNRNPSQLRDRLIKAQYYSFDELTTKGSDLVNIYEQIAQTGCVVLLDEFSMFHPLLRHGFQSSRLAVSSQVALVTLSPFEPYSRVPNSGLEGELKQMLVYAFTRFADWYDVRYEFSVGDERRLKRWLHTSLPQTVMGLQDLHPDESLLEVFKQKAGSSGDKFKSFLYSSS